MIHFYIFSVKVIGASAAPSKGSADPAPDNSSDGIHTRYVVYCDVFLFKFVLNILNRSSKEIQNTKKGKGKAKKDRYVNLSFNLYIRALIIIIERLVLIRWLR